MGSYGEKNELVVMFSRKLYVSVNPNEFFKGVKSKIK